MTTFAARLDEACYDFESLLLLGRSCLDRITGFTMNLFGMESKHVSFSRLRDIFQGNCPKRFNQNYFISILNESKWLEDFMISDEMDSLRDTIAHYSSYSEKTQFCSNIAKVGSETIIVTDFESHNIPLFETAWNISRFIPFFVLNLLASFNNLQTLSLKDYIPKWKNWTTKISEFLENKNNQPLKADNITLFKNTNPDGFETRTDNVLSSIYSKKITYCLQ